MALVDQVNLSKLESRPVPDAPFQYRFSDIVALRKKYKPRHSIRWATTA